ncbi:MAG: DNA-directed RNA polymerase subunit beta', partial [bacterium]
ANEIIVRAGEEIREEHAARIEDSSIDHVRIRSVLTCASRRGVCALCYGRNLANGRMVELGEAVGVIGAQSIGEPGTQLTLRTFHIGGVAGRIVEQSQIKARTNGLVKYPKLPVVEIGEGGNAGKWIVTGHKGDLELVDDEGRTRHRYSPPYGATIHVADGANVEEGQPLFEWDTYNTPILTERNGTVRFGDIKERVTVRDVLDENTGLRQQVIVDDKEKVLQPHIDVIGAAGQRLAHYPLPTGAMLLIKDGDKVTAGTVVAKIRRDISKTRDITGGLPRVSELLRSSSRTRTARIASTWCRRASTWSSRKVCMSAPASA